MTSRELEDRHTSGLYTKRPIVLVRGEGSRVWDEDGREYLDCTSGIGVAALGHAHPVVLDAIARQAPRLVTCHELFYNDERAALLASLDRVTPPAIARFFLCNSGTEANEAAIKFARMSTGRTAVVALMRGYHGKTLGSLSATWEKKYREPFEPLVPDFHFVPANDIDRMRDAVTERTAAILLEVVQGEGGVRPLDAGFLRAVRQRCDETGALLVIDEVQTGFARTGRMFAFEHHGVAPDILTLAKAAGGGLPIGIVGFGDTVQLPVKLAHTTTFGGGPLVCAVARAVIDHIASAGLAEQVAEAGRVFLERLRAIPSPRIRQVRGLGLMVGIELKEQAAPYALALMEQGVLVLLAGSTVLRFLPPLTISREELDLVAARVARAVR